MKKKASANNNLVKLMIEKLLDKVQEYAKKYLDKFEKAILNEKSGSPDKNSTIKNLSMTAVRSTQILIFFMLVEEHKRSDFSYRQIYLYLREIKRDLNILEIFYQQTETLRQLGVAVYTAASVPELLLSQQSRSYILNLCLLPPNGTDFFKLTWSKNFHRVVTVLFKEFTFKSYISCSRQPTLL